MNTISNPSNNNLKGIAIMIIGMIGMAGTDASGKWLMTSDYSVFQVIAVRGWIIVTLMMAWIVLTKRTGQLRTRRPKAHGIRLLLAFGGPVLMFSALAKMPLADVTVIIFGSTFLTTALSVPLFKEKVGIHRWSAVILGFVGVVIALRPGAGVFEPIAILALLAGVAFSTINLTARWLRDTESTLSITFYTMAGMAVLASFAVPFVWQPIPLNDLVVFTIMSVFTIIGYLGMTGAFVIAPVSVVAPFEYTVMIFAVISGWVIWGDVPDEYVWTGAAIIVASGIYLIQREARLRNVEAN
ncbi:MAG: DMT family transporter [Rhodospirillales bacterium]|jgi:drug/metabolite transporter (DMT)-like permease